MMKFSIKRLFSFYILLLVTAHFCMGNSLKSQDSLETKKALQQFIVTEISPFPGGVQGLAIDDSGTLYFSDTYSKLHDISKVYMLHPPYTGKPIATNIEGISIAGLMWTNEKLYVSFLNKNEIIVYDNNLEFLESRPVNSPVGFASDGKNVYVLSYFGNIGIVTNNRVKIHMEGLERPYDIQYSGKESLWVSEQGNGNSSGSVSEIAYEGIIIKTLDHKFNEPAGLGMDRTGNLYIADQGDNKIYKVNQEGETILVSDQYTAPRCIASMADGGVMVSTDHKGGMLLIITPAK